MTQAPALDPELLERLRRGVPLRLTADGRLLFDEEPVTHERVDQALREGLDLSDEGETIVHLGRQWCYLHVDDTPLRATALREDGGALHIRLDDGRDVPLDLETVWEEPEKGLRCSVPSRHSGRALPVRFTNEALMDLSDFLREDGEQSVLEVGGRRWEVPQRDPRA